MEGPTELSLNLKPRNHFTAIAPGVSHCTFAAHRFQTATDLCTEITLPPFQNPIREVSYRSTVGKFQPPFEFNYIWNSSTWGHPPPLVCKASGEVSRAAPGLTSTSWKNQAALEDITHPLPSSFFSCSNVGVHRTEQIAANPSVGISLALRAAAAAVIQAALSDEPALC